MTVLSFTNGRVVTPGGLLDGAAIALDGDRIAAIGPARGGLDLEGGVLMPGFIDTQVNGGGGVLFNDETTVAGIVAIGAAHARFGTTGFLPTLISDDLDRVAMALDAAEAAIAAGVQGVLGAHIEGPFLSPARHGIHETSKFRRLDPETIALLTRPRRGRVMLTLAPELCSTADIAALVRGGVIVSAGHTDADYDTAMAAIAAGATGVTHLFNAMSPLNHRAPGVVGAALDSGRAWCGLIADGVHLHPAAMRIAMRALPPDRLMLVTDAMPSVGASADRFTLQGKTIMVRGGMCVAADGTLAGSHLDMARAVRVMTVSAGASLEQASAMASANPAAFLGFSNERGALKPGLRADWVWLDANFQPRGTWIGGVRA